MNANEREIHRREVLARRAIRDAVRVSKDEYGVKLFFAHHLSELGPEYWVQRFGVPRPSTDAILERLVLSSHWGLDDENDLDVFDFTLPGDATNYMLAVYFTPDGEIDHVTMES